MSDDLGVATARQAIVSLEGRLLRAVDSFRQNQMVHNKMDDQELSQLTREAFRYSGKTSAKNVTRTIKEK
ncbi:hypothetical protein OH492_17520 [Vibrio chagasii]|nr:hypothetical protein [Vibrio chagasii]